MPVSIYSVLLISWWFSNLGMLPHPGARIWLSTRKHLVGPLSVQRLWLVCIHLWLVAFCLLPRPHYYLAYLHMSRLRSLLLSPLCCMRSALGMPIWIVLLSVHFLSLLIWKPVLFLQVFSMRGSLKR